MEYLVRPFKKYFSYAKKFNWPPTSKMEKISQQPSVHVDLLNK